MLLQHVYFQKPDHRDVWLLVTSQPVLHYSLRGLVGPFSSVKPKYWYSLNKKGLQKETIMVSNRKVIKIKANYGNTCSIKITKGVDPQLKGVMCSDNKRYFQILKDNFVKNKQKKNTS